MKMDKFETEKRHKMIEDYLKVLQDSWMNYQPEEKPKLDGAEIKVVGDYVMYAILSDADRATAFKAFESALKYGALSAQCAHWAPPLAGEAALSPAFSKHFTRFFSLFSYCNLFGVVVKFHFVLKNQVFSQGSLTNG